DTGTNMLFTMRAALAEVTPGQCLAQTAAALAGGAARGARGNSGVVLAEILQALADVTAEVTADGDLTHVSTAVLAAVLRHALARVVTAMGGEFVAGTVVSVLQAAADAMERAETDGDGLDQALVAAGAAAAEALDCTTEQLGALTEAGVVDAGGRGLLVLLDSLTVTVTGHRPVRRHYPPAVLPAAPVGAPVAPPEFEVMYLLDGRDGAAVDGLRSRLEVLGDSVAVSAAAAGRHSVHVHTDDAGAAIEAGLAAGAVSRIRIAGLTSGRVAPGGWSRERAVLAVVDGDGAAALFGSEGACVLRPDAELVDPANGVSAAELLRALVDTGAAQVMVLPNGYVAAEDLVAGCAAGIGWGIDVVPLPAGSMVQGLAALAVHDPSRAAVDDGYAMARAAAGARHGAVRGAVETALTWAGTCRPGDGLGLVGEEVLVVAEDIPAAAAGLVDLLLGAGGELVTVLLSSGIEPSIAEELAEHVHRHHPGVDIVSYRTGHRGDALLIGVE
ncbi:MAG: DAK2 domain-containing protein, partial [Mycobacterium sp.]|nr:DAK2 domain-containing protein [Mycobacterium sp.]